MSPPDGAHGAPQGPSRARGADRLVSGRSAIGAAVGALMGSAMSGSPMGAGVGALLGGAVAVASNRPKPVMTPAREVIYNGALKWNDPEALLTLASGFESQGLKVHAAQLRKRAVRLAPRDESTRADRRLAYFKLICCDDPKLLDEAVVRLVASGALRAAKCIEEHCAAVRAAAEAATPLAPQVQEAFASKLLMAIENFGPQGPQAESAARNLIRSQGRDPKDLVAETIAKAAELP